MSQALVCAHAREVTHRDLKPQNVFLARRGGASEEVVKVLDFGISKMWADGKPMHLTQTGHVLGTPVYMSPEHARRDFDGRSLFRWRAPGVTQAFGLRCRHQAANSSEVSE